MTDRVASPHAALPRTALPRPTYIDSDGVRVATYVIEPDGLPRGDVVLCHGTPWSAAVWGPVAALLSAHYRLFLWDMPGYGTSISHTAKHVDLVSQRTHLAAVLDYWGLARPHVVAHDIGGAVALGSHLLAGRDFSSLYLLDIVTLDPWGSPFFRLVAQHQAVFLALPLNLHTALVREYIASAGGEALDPAWVSELSRPWSTPGGQRAFYRQIAQLSPQHTGPITARLDQVRCPVRIGWGERDPWIPASQAAELAARMPGPVDVAMYPGAGHLVPLEAAQELADDVLNFLRRAH